MTLIIVVMDASFYLRYCITLGETTNTLLDYSIDDEDYIFYQKSIGKKLRNFGFADNRESLIDELGRIYFIPDSGDLYYLGGKFYEGLYNLRKLQ